VIVVDTSAILEVLLNTPASARIALAEALGAPLVTRDGGLASRGIHRATVELL